MKRRSFLKSLSVIPAIGLTPAFGFEFNDDNSLASNTPNSSGLDKIIDIIKEDKRLNKKVSQSDIIEAIRASFITLKNKLTVHIPKTPKTIVSPYHPR